MSPVHHSIAARPYYAHWVTGTLLALSSAAFVRWVAAELAPTPRAVATILGTVLSCVGLLVIARGTRQRARPP